MAWKRVLKWVVGGVAGVVLLAVVVVAIQMVLFDRSLDDVYEVPTPDIVASTDSAVLARGAHLAASRGCIDCHGDRLQGRVVDDLGPLGVMIAPNITTGQGGRGGAYTDATLARAIRYGVNAEGRSLLFMPTTEFSWWPDEELAAVVSFVRAMPPADGAVDPSRVGPVGKVLAGFGVLEPRSAATVDADAPREAVPAPEATARYGAFLARGCAPCHGESFSGGPIPGAPSSLPVPANLTPHETGLAAWTRDDFDRALNTGVRPDGRTLEAFMPITSTRAMDDVEKGALWAYFRSLEPVAFGNR